MTTPLCQTAEIPTVLQFSGPDALRYLNGQMTQDVSDLGNTAKLSCITDAKGRLEHLITVQNGPTPESIWVVSSHDAPEALRSRLERYLIADDVDVEDLSGSWQRIHAAQSVDGAEFARQAEGIFGEGVDLWWPAGSAPEGQGIDDEQKETLRIEHGIPAWGSEITPGILPPEAGLDRHAISYRKGCYIGQEVLSRIKSAGKVNRRLALLEPAGSVSAGDLLMIDDRNVGEITSVAPNGELALAWVKKAGYESETYLAGAVGLRRRRWI